MPHHTRKCGNKGYGRKPKKTQQHRRKSKATRARRAARDRRSTLAKRRTLASILARDSVAELRRRQNERAVRDYMDMHYRYDPDDEYYPRDWQKRYNL